MPELFFYFGEEEVPEGQGRQLIYGSVVWERLAPTIEDIHAYGCRLAERQNGKLRASGTFKDAKRKVYCGAYAFPAASVRSLLGLENLSEVESADIVHKIEDGEIAHAEIRIVLRSDADLQGTKTAIIDRLWSAGLGPMKHVCSCDADLDAHPSGLLTVGRAGDYVVRHSLAHRLWNLAKFQMARLCLSLRQRLGFGTS